MKIIELLDGSTWDRGTILEKMQDDSFYYGHLAKHALSSSACKLLLSSPKTYHYVTKYGQDESDAFTVGRLVHLMALEPHRMQEYDIIDVQSKNTNMWKDAKARGGQIITKKEYNEARRIADALLRNEYFLFVDIIKRSVVFRLTNKNRIIVIINFFYCLSKVIH